MFIQKISSILMLSVCLFSSSLLASDSDQEKEEILPRARGGVCNQEVVSVNRDVEEVTRENHNKKYDKGKDLHYRAFRSREEVDKYRESEKIEKIIYRNKDRREILNEVIQGTDWNCHFYLEVIYYFETYIKMYHASGILIDPHIILTAAHNLYGTEDDGNRLADRVDCFAACYQNSVLAETTVFPTRDQESVFVPEDYINTKGRSSDIALIFFKDDKVRTSNDADHQGQIGKLANILTIATPLQVNKINRSLKEMEVNVTGYPGQRIAYTMQGPIIGEPESDLVKYDIDTEPGQSGSGIWFKYKDQEGKERIGCIGVHAYPGDKGEDHNIGVLLHREIIDKLKEYNGFQ